MTIQLKRIYEEPTDNDGIRVLVDRLWPRGVSKDQAKLDVWLKDIGPSHELRKWFKHDPVKFPEFTKKYQTELKSGEQNKAFKQLVEIVENNDQRITLLFASKEEKYNHVTILKEILDEVVEAF